MLLVSKFIDNSQLVVASFGGEVGLELVAVDQ